MELLEQKIKEYIASISVPDEISPVKIRLVIEDSGQMTAGMFLKRLKDLKISGSEFLELLGNSKIGNMEFRRIEENPHLKFDELLHILDNSVLSSDDYHMIISVAAQRQAVREERKKREEETLRRMKMEISGETDFGQETGISDESPVSEEAVGTVEENAAEAAAKTDALSAAEALVARLQADIDREYGAETEQTTIKNEKAKPDYTQSISDTSALQDEDTEADIGEKLSTQEFCIPEGEADGYTDDDEFDELTEEEEIGASAQDIGLALDDLVDKKEKTEKIIHKRSKGALIAAFVCAAVVVLSAVSLKTLREYGIIPTYTFKIPQIIKQNIVDFPTLLEEVKSAESKISYLLPDNFSQKNKNVNKPKNAVGETVTAAISTVGDISYVCGAKTEDGKVSDTFNFDSQMSDPSIVYAEGTFVLTGTIDGMTVIRFFDEASLSDGEFVKEFKQSGKFVGYYTDGNAFYAVTTDEFDLKQAAAEKLTSFIPHFVSDTATSVIPFDSIVLPDIAAGLSYCTVARLPLDGGKSTVKTVLTGEAGGYYIGADSLYVCDNIYFNDEYTARVTRILFNDKLNESFADVNGALNPSQLMDCGSYFIATGVSETEGGYDNTIFRFNAELTNVAVLCGVASGETIATAYCGDDILSLITAGENAMQYNINLSDLSAADSDKPVRLTKKIGDRLYAGVHVTYDSEGNRTGLVLSVTDKGETKEISVKADSTVQGNWNAYLDSQAIEDISGLSVCTVSDETVIALPLTYFDGISQVSEYRFYTYDGQIMAKGKISLYDEQYSTAYCDFSGGSNPYILAMWDNRIITADISNISVISDTVIS